MEAAETNIWQILAGIGLFLFGMQLMEQAIRLLAGRTFKVFLRNQTSHPFKAILAGLLVTSLLQSSSIVNLLILAFVGARVLSLRNAIAILLGSNLGSTVYNWIVVYLGFKFDIQSFAFPIMAIGAIGLIFFQGKKKVMQWTTLLFGISLLFIGLSNIKSGVETVVATVDLSGYSQYGNFVFVLVGFAITAIVQSSATTVVITLAALNAGAVQFEAAACLVIGSESGTAMKTVIGSIGKVADKKRVALSNFLINITSSLVAFIFLSALITLIKDILGVKDPLIALVSFQSIINLIGIILLYPFLDKFSKWMENRFSDESDKIAINISTLIVNEPEEALKGIQKEYIRLLHNIISVNRQALEIHPQKTVSKTTLNFIIPQSNGKSYSEYYELVKHLNGEIIDFCLELQSKELAAFESKKLEELIVMLRSTMNAAKSVKDIRHNIKQFRDSGNDTLHNFYLLIKKNEEPFYLKLEELISGENGNNLSYLSAFLQETKNNHDNFIKQIYNLSTSHKIKDLELATLINVFGELQYSHESLIHAMNNHLIIKKVS
ncbi:MAG: Na/Pi cotransporter family protein [Bacteroidetes bacterium]|nr:Na/Pi cotransporter family protein [Bacteroidota bacterium]